MDDLIRLIEAASRNAIRTVEAMQENIAPLVRQTQQMARDAQRAIEPIVQNVVATVNRLDKEARRIVRGFEPAILQIQQTAQEVFNRVEQIMGSVLDNRIRIVGLTLSVAVLLTALSEKRTAVAEDYDGNWRIARRVTGNDHDANDAIQQAIVAFLAIPSYRQLENPQVYLRTMVKHESLKMAGQHSDHCSCDMSDIEDRDVASLEYDSRRLKVLLEELPRLPTSDQQLLLGFYKHGHSGEQLAAMFGLSKEAVWTRLSRLRRKLHAVCMKRLLD